MRPNISSAWRSVAVLVTAAGLVVAAGGAALARGPVDSPTSTLRASIVPSVGPEASGSAGAAAALAEAEEAFRSQPFRKFAGYAVTLADAYPHSAPLQLMCCEALLASGAVASAEAKALEAWKLAAGQSSNNTLGTADERAAAQRCAARLWTTARLRQGKSLDDASADPLFVRLAEQGGAAEIVFWRQRLSSHRPYGVTVYRARGRRGHARFAVVENATCRAIPVEVNGRLLAQGCIDTGSQYTLLTPEAAKRAGVATGPAVTELVGFASLAGQPAVAGRLRIGNVELRNVPVLVAQSAAMKAASADVVLGNDLLYHLRLSIDEPSESVSVHPAGRRAPPRRHWRIELWTFSKACLAQAYEPNGRSLRVLIDTGNHSGVFVSRRFLSGRSPQGAMLSFVGRVVPSGLPSLELDNRCTEPRTVRGALPAELDRLGLFDVLLPGSLLAPGTLTLDLKNRYIELSASE